MEELKFEFNKITDENNIDRLSDLMFACFGKKADKSYFKWKYFDNPAGDLVAFEALYEGKSVGFYGIIPELYSLNGKVEKVYQSMDTMTHPDFQRRGLFIKLAKMTYEDVIQREGKLFLVGFPGSQSFGGFVKKLDWKAIKEDCRYIFTASSLFALKNFLSTSRNAEIQNYRGINDELKEYFTQISPSASIAKHFDADIFQWKVFDNPNYDYQVIGLKKDGKLRGVCVYRIENPKSCEISWLKFIDENDYQIYTSDFLKYIFAQAKTRYIYTWKPQKGALADGYRKAGLLENTINKGPFTSEFPLIIYEKGYSSLNSENFDNYDFQPLMLD